MSSPWRFLALGLFALTLLSLCSCGISTSGRLSYAAQGRDPLGSYTLTGGYAPCA